MSTGPTTTCQARTPGGVVQALEEVGFIEVSDSSDPMCEGGTVLVRPVSFPGRPHAIYCLPGTDGDGIVDTLKTVWVQADGQVTPSHRVR